MVNRSSPTVVFWNCLGIAIAILAIGTSYSLSQAKVYQLELAQYKLQVGTSLVKVQEASNALEQAAQNLPIAPQHLADIERLTTESNVIINSAEQRINEQIKPLVEAEIAK